MAGWMHDGEDGRREKRGYSINNISSKKKDQSFRVAEHQAAGDAKIHLESRVSVQDWNQATLQTGRTVASRPPSLLSDSRRGAAFIKGSSRTHGSES